MTAKTYDNAKNLLVALCPEPPVFFVDHRRFDSYDLANRTNRPVVGEVAVYMAWVNSLRVTERSEA